MLIKLKLWYLNFLEKDKKNVLEAIFYLMLYLFSLLYGTVVFFRNFFYNKKIFSSFLSKAKVISVGNLSWSGTGKTPLSIWLYKKLSSKFKVAVLRRPYAQDEEKMLQEKVKNVFSCPNRQKIAKEKESFFDVFILDDGFGHRKLKRDIDIVIMGAREFKRKHDLIPANFFREPLKALRRADIVLLNHAGQMAPKAKESVLKVAPKLKVYFSRYVITKFLDKNGNEIGVDYLRNKKIAAFCAIGYPEGFFNKLKEINLKVVRKITYPDHHELSKVQFKHIEDSLLKEGISDLVITHKDKYHIPDIETKLNIFIMEIEIEIENEADFLQEIYNRLFDGAKPACRQAGAKSQ